VAVVHTLTKWDRAFSLSDQMEAGWEKDELMREKVR
jgi:hypothetical protein